MISSRDVAAFQSLRTLGATIPEIAIVLSVVREVNEGGAVIDLGSKVWEHETRGKDGRWVRGNPVEHPALQALSAGRAVQSGHALSPEHDPAETDAMHKPATMRHLAIAQAQTLKIAHESGQDAARRAVQQAMEIHQEAERQHDIKEGKNARKKLLGMAAALVGGAGISYAEAKLGVPDIAQALSGISPAMAEALYEWKNRL